MSSGQRLSPTSGLLLTMSAWSGATRRISDRMEARLPPSRAISGSKKALLATLAAPKSSQKASFLAPKRPGLPANHRVGGCRTSMEAIRQYTQGQGGDSAAPPEDAARRDPLLLRPGRVPEYDGPGALAEGR